jgi:DNA-binding XRE family transcriptional regulator
MIDVCRLIQRMRHDAGLTQQQVADRIGTSQSCVAFWENGDRRPYWKTIEKIADACGMVVTIEYKEKA